ncbi:hypothetical protein HUW46_09215 [Amycolatopsis sp. CA-230715]|nr:hypothetical protein HUW46_09215 [Amycolatopsis sp. CA-230715]
MGVMAKHYVIQVSIKEITEATEPETDRYNKTIKDGSPQKHRDVVSVTTCEDTLSGAVRKTLKHLDTELQLVDQSDSDYGG